ncbi:hypothetical protein BU24DRAFT_264076 [Aaosphaeria arxii CBS 175.79]|uniref:Rhodopsin domain-containing protein n=1 Tax=Aaosphaeria arxii CBS 175.79 TaxID=1450172 RepID=A0A6A5XJR1_9PLEO|nr:uncharacterized protein BU24DRAFT_264076 [Aaosphaeria arxii CBS 175.79]KAF2013081.1 hypothetical protein BU24DRAFT_264076 [Aaosphaeria arxii CBS 175.79]
MVSLSFSKITIEEINYQILHYNENRGHVVIVVTSIFFTLALLSVVFRFVTKKLRGIKCHTEDVLILFALILAIGLWAEALLSVKFGAGKHSMRVVQEGGVDYISKNLQITYNVAHLSVKASILFFYKRIFTFVVITFKRAWFAIFGYIIITTLVGVILVFTQCRPLRYAWDEPKGIEGECINLTALEISTGVLIASADLMLLVLPMPVLWSLRVSTKEKLLLCGLFALGLLALLASIIRITVLGQVVSSVDFTCKDFPAFLSILLMHDKVLTQVNVDVMVNALVWSLVEVNIGIICACIPTIKPLFNRNAKIQSTIAVDSDNSRTRSKTRSKRSETDNDTLAISLDEYPLTRNSSIPEPSI